MTPLAPCVAALVTVSIWLDTQLSGDDGPRNWAGSTWSSCAACLAPSFAWSKTAMPVCLGTKTDLKSFPGANFTGPLAAPPELAAPPLSPDEPSSSSPPQAATARTNAAIAAARTHAMRFICLSPLLLLSDCGRWLQLWRLFGRLTSVRGGRCPLTQPRRAPRAGDPGDEVGDQNREDQQNADDPGLGVLVDVREPQTVADVEHDQNRQRDADHRARASEDAHAAEQDHRDDVEPEAGGQIAAARAEPRREEDPRQAGH